MNDSNVPITSASPAPGRPEAGETPLGGRWTYPAFGGLS